MNRPQQLIEECVALVIICHPNIGLVRNRLFLVDDSLTMAGECAAADSLYGAQIYGIGNSTEAVYYLDTPRDASLPGSLHNLLTAPPQERPP